MASNPYESPENEGNAPARGTVGCVLKLLAAMLVAGLLIALLLPATRSARESPASCVVKLKSIATALHMYEAKYQTLPPAYTVDAHGNRLHSWRTLILPYIEQGALYSTIDLSKPWDDPANKEACETKLFIFQCPSANIPPNHTTYFAAVGPNAFSPGLRPRRFSEITDGPAQTIMLVEGDTKHSVPWMAPTDLSEGEILSLKESKDLAHPGLFNVSNGGTEVRSLSQDIEPAKLHSLISIDGNDNDVIKDFFR